MVSCLSFTTELECALHYTNEFNIKLILLITLLGFILFSLWYSRDLSDPLENIYTFFKYISFNIFPKILLVFFPFFLLTLKLDVSSELVITTLGVIYFIVIALFLGLSLGYGKEKIINIIGDKRDFKHKLKYMKYK